MLQAEAKNLANSQDFGRQIEEQKRIEDQIKNQMQQEQKKVSPLKNLKDKIKEKVAPIFAAKPEPVVKEKKVQAPAIAAEQQMAKIVSKQEVFLEVEAGGLVEFQWVVRNNTDREWPKKVSLKQHATMLNVKD